MSSYSKKKSASVLKALAAASAAIFCMAAPAWAQRLPRVDVIDGDKVHQLLEPDEIPSIDAPLFVGAAEADFMRDEEPVVGVVLNGVAKAYSVWHLDRHEIVNDDFKGDPVSVTW